MPGGKIGAFIALMIVAMLAAGLFGALHNQLSYTVGPTYFTAFKFLQFQTDPSLAPRLASSIVGWQASWWMGALVGLPVMTYGLMRAPTPRLLWIGGFGAIGTVLFVAAICALGGLAVGFGFVALDLDPLVPVITGVRPDEFVRAGMMHDFSYLGGLIGAVAAFWPMTRAVRHKGEA